MATQTTGLKTNANIIEQWNDGYKLEIDITAESQLQDWQLDFNLPNTIIETYGVDLIDRGNGNYSFNGQDHNQNLNLGETTKAIFIVSDNGSGAVLPQFNFNSPAAATVEIEEHGIINSKPGSGQFAYGEALQKSFLFFEANRSGSLPDDSRLEWRSDSALQDGSDVGLDLTGGYYDAGDHVKFGFPMAATTTMLSWGVEEYGDAYSRSGQLDEALEAIKWSTDYMLKAHVTDENGTKEYWGQVGHSWTDHSVWDSAENMTMERPAYKIDRENPGSDLAAETAAALAAASIIFRPSNPAYADTLLENAQQLYDFAEQYQGKYSDSITDAQAWYYSNEFVDELAWGATWLYKATENSDYLNKAENYYDGLGGWTYNWNDKSYGTGVLLAQETNNSQYRNDVEQWLDQWINGEGSVKRTAGGLAWLSEWGSLRYAANTAFLAGVYNDTVREDARYDKFVTEQIDYILGDNPRNASYMVGFGNNYPQQPHHRSASGVKEVTNPESNKHILYGALVGGPASTDDFDYNDRRDDYISNEVATDYNAAFTGALARMYDVYGGDPLTEGQLDDLIGVDANGVGF